MSEASEMERTEDPTPQRRQEARDEGRIPKSQDLTAAALLLGSAAVLGATGPGLGRLAMDAFGYGLTAVGSADLDARSAVTLVETLGWKVIAALMVANTALAVLSRAAPSLNIMSVAFPIQIGVGLLAMSAALPLIATALAGWEPAYDHLLTRVLGAATGGAR